MSMWHTNGWSVSHPVPKHPSVIIKLSFGLLLSFNDAIEKLSVSTQFSRSNRVHHFAITNPTTARPQYATLVNDSCVIDFFFYAKYGDAGLILLFINNFSVLRSRPSISCVWKCNVCQRFRSIKYFELVSFGVCYCWPSINWSHCDDCFQLDNEKKKKNRKT